MCFWCHSGSDVYGNRRHGFHPNAPRHASYNCICPNSQWTWNYYSQHYRPMLATCIALRLQYHLRSCMRMKRRYRNAKKIKKLFLLINHKGLIKSASVSHLKPTPCFLPATVVKNIILFIGNTWAKSGDKYVI